MNKRQFYILLIFVLLSVSLMAFAWEFWIENFVGTLLFGEFESESGEERWEYVISIALFALLSLIYPFIIGKVIA